MPLLETKGAASAQGFGEFAKVGAANYIEDVFSTWLYTGTGSAQTITNGIDLSTYGGLVFGKCRSTGGSTYVPTWVSNATGLGSFLNSSSTAGLGGLTASTFNTNGFTINTANSRWNESGQTYASWTFRKQPKFFDVVTYTGNGTARTIAHSLGSVPGCMIIKRTDAARDWAVYHRSLGATKGIYLNTVDAEFTSATALWNGTTPTSTQFSVGTNGDVNASGATYVAYLFAHNAGGFGLTGTDNVISCGGYTGTGAAGNAQTLGYEPQWLLVKRTSGTEDWYLFDNMRGLPGGTTGDVSILRPNTSGAETQSLLVNITATGFSFPGGGGINVSGNTYIYIAIRRGPMKTPTTGTSVFSPIATSAAPDTVLTTGFPIDAAMYALRNTAWTYNSTISNRLTGLPSPGATSTDVPRLQTSSTAAELVAVSAPYRVDNTGFTINPGFGGSIPVIYWNFRRAPGFFDVVCFTGTGSARTLSHNLTVAPELMILKARSEAEDWSVFYNFGASSATGLVLQSTAASFGVTYASNGTLNGQPTASSFFLGSNTGVNKNTITYVAYLFASVAGVSKVGSYTGTGTTLQIDCGFTGGARFVLIKRTDSTGDWYCWDSSRGIVSGNDSYLVLNSTAAEVTNTDWVDTYSAGFELSNAAGNNVNINGASYIFLSVA